MTVTQTVLLLLKNTQNKSLKCTGNIVYCFFFIVQSLFLLVDTSDKILNDVDIQTFGQELTKSKSEGGVGLK